MNDKLKARMKCLIFGHRRRVTPILQWGECTRCGDKG